MSHIVLTVKITCVLEASDKIKKLFKPHRVQDLEDPEDSVSAEFAHLTTKSKREEKPEESKTVEAAITTILEESQERAVKESMTAKRTTVMKFRTRRQIAQYARKVKDRVRSACLVRN